LRHGMRDLYQPDIVRVGPDGIIFQ
jgi:hypothetical protein